MSEKMHFFQKGASDCVLEFIFRLVWLRRFEFLCFNFEFRFPGLFRISIFEFRICRQELTDNSHDGCETL
jgi:hypothetical protein